MLLKVTVYSLTGAFAPGLVLIVTNHLLQFLELRVMPIPRLTRARPFLICTSCVLWDIANSNLSMLVIDNFNVGWLPLIAPNVLTVDCNLRHDVVNQTEGFSEIEVLSCRFATKLSQCCTPFREVLHKNALWRT